MRESLVLKLPQGGTWYAVIVAVCAFVVVTPQLEGDTVQYADLQGDNVHFDDISETFFTPDPLFGEPEIEGNSIRFPGFGFAAQAVHCELAFVNGRLDMTVRAHPNEEISSLTVSEFGSFFLNGTDSLVMSSAVINVEADGEMISSAMSFSSEDENNSSWSDWMTISFDDPVEEVSIVFDSRLLSLAGNREVAFIDKGGIQLSFDTVSALPEPSTLSCLGIVGFLGIFARRRRRSA